MNRCLKLSVLSALVLASAQVLAMDLGQIQVKSALDRPLLAEIPLNPEHPGEADHLKVTLAPADAFAKAGIRREDLKVPLNFEVATDASGQKVIRITSAQPVHEPYLDFLIQVTWPKGKLLREYTVLLDPLSSASTPRTTTTAPTAGKRTARPSTQATARQPAQSSTPSDDVYGPVQHGDTLSHIARANALDGVSYQQMLVALKAANPDAFFKDNVNALKTGAVLRIPTRQQAREVTRQAAIAAVREQNQSWQSRRAPTMVASAGGSSESVGPNGTGDSSGDHLSLVPPDEKGAAAAGAATSDGTTSADKLRQELARSKEALSSQKQAAADLESRVGALEQLEQKNKRLLSLKNAEIAELREKLAEVRKRAGLPALPASSEQAGLATTASSADAVATSASAGDVAPVEAASTGAAAVAAANAGSTAEAAVTAMPEPAGKQPVADASRSEGASMPWYEQLWARIVLVVLIVVLIVWALMRRRRSGNKPAKASLADQFGDSPIDGDAVDEDEFEADSDSEADAPEALDDGESELLTQLAAQPGNVGLHLELASLYYARGDADRFEAIAESMHAYLDDEDQPEWAEIRDMGRELSPDHPLFADAPDAPVAAERDDNDSDGSPLSTDETDVADESGPTTDQEPQAEPYKPAPGGYSFDFNLVSESEPADIDGDEGGAAPSSGLPSEEEFDNLPPLDAETRDGDAEPDDNGQPSFEEPENTTSDDAGFTLDEDDDAAADFARDGFSDDPVDTKLDLARAYIDMGDHESARSMLQEAINEGSQMQQDTARQLLDNLD